MEARKSFILHFDSLEILDELTDEQAGKLFKAIKANRNGEELEVDQLVKIALSPFKSQFLRDDEKYLNVVNRNRINGPKGGRPKKTKEPKEPSGFIENPKKPKKAVSDSDSEGDGDRDGEKSHLLGHHHHHRSFSSKRAKYGWRVWKAKYLDEGDVM